MSKRQETSKVAKSKCQFLNRLPKKPPDKCREPRQLDSRFQNSDQSCRVLEGKEAQSLALGLCPMLLVENCGTVNGTECAKNGTEWHGIADLAVE